MAQTTDPGDLVARVRRDVGRNLSRARNGVKYVTGIDRPQVGLGCSRFHGGRTAWAPVAAGWGPPPTRTSRS